MCSVCTLCDDEQHEKWLLHKYRYASLWGSGYGTEVRIFHWHTTNLYFIHAKCPEKLTRTLVIVEFQVAAIRHSYGNCLCARIRRRIKWDTFVVHSTLPAAHHQSSARSIVCRSRAEPRACLFYILVTYAVCTKVKRWQNEEYSKLTVELYTSSFNNLSSCIGCSSAPLNHATFTSTLPPQSWVCLCMA